MQNLRETTEAQSLNTASLLPVSVIVAARNEAHNLPRCLESLRGMGEVYLIDSQSTDATVEIARSYGATVVQFHYPGGWPKKRQWAMDTLPLAHDWVFLVDADEALTPELLAEIETAIRDPHHDGYFVRLQMHFLGRRLRYSDAAFYKLSLFRRGKGRFECRLRDQDGSMCDMEVHEHVVVDGKTSRLRNPLLHHNVESLSRYIRKHDEYSNWEARVWLSGEQSYTELPPSVAGSQAQRRRWLKLKLYRVPGSPLLLFIYKYVVRLGFLDGIPGLIYCTLQAVQMFHVKAKMFEARNQIPGVAIRPSPPTLAAGSAAKDVSRNPEWHT
jgi:glycosyltransferase involved in cell wall biosynthesis